jgi:hypothetical protein
VRVGHKIRTFPSPFCFLTMLFSNSFITLHSILTITLKILRGYFSNDKNAFKASG